MGSPEVGWQGAGASSSTYVAAYDVLGSLVLYRHVVSTAPTRWDPPTTISPPPAQTFQKDPGFCLENPAIMGNFGAYLVSVAGGRLFVTTSPAPAPAQFSAWMQIHNDAASSPDCAILSDRTVHVVALNAAGQVVAVSGSGAAWTVTNLGVF